MQSVERRGIVDVQPHDSLIQRVHNEQPVSCVVNSEPIRPPTGDSKRLSVGAVIVSTLNFAGIPPVIPENLPERDKLQSLDFYNHYLYSLIC